MALWPAGEQVYGWWNQRALQAAWQDIANDATSSRTAKEVALSSTAGNIHHSTVASLTHKKPAERAHAKAPSKSKLRTWMPTKISIPDINLDAVVVQGIGPAMLRQGPGHDPASALPGDKGNCVIAAHRNAYGWWFYGLSKLDLDSLVQLKMPGETLTYRVVLTRVVKEDDLSVLQQTDYPRLTLYTCTLPKSDQRVVVVAHLVARQPS
jgi:LPXTG-site transpeptidase (sortase) family protein